MSSEVNSTPSDVKQPRHDQTAASPQDAGLFYFDEPAMIMVEIPPTIVSEAGHDVDDCTSDCVENICFCQI